MPIYDIYSRRKKKESQAEADVYQYVMMPPTLRTQIRRILEDAIGPFWESYGYSTSTPPQNNQGWHFIRDTICREKGLLSLANEESPKDDCIGYLHGEVNVDDVLDLVEFGVRYVDRVIRRMNTSDRRGHGIKTDPDDAIAELNFRFREAAFGYQFESGKIIRVDSQLIHSEIVKPALQLLSDPRFAGPHNEFLAAHAHYRAGEYKDCITDALNSFESTMKVICELKKWEYEKGARAIDLIKVIRSNRLLPEYLDASFDQLISTLKSGLPKVRNEEGAHGQGAKPREAPCFIAAYSLHLAAAKIVLLVEAFNNGK